MVHRLLLALAAGLALPLAASAQSAGSSSSNLRTCSNPQYGFSLQYPAGLTPHPVDGSWSAAEDLSNESVSGTPIVSITVSIPDFTAEARVGFSNFAAACCPEAKTVAINGVPFKRVHFDDAAMLKYETVESYRVVHDGRCYSVDQIVHGDHYNDESMTPAARDAQTFPPSFSPGGESGSLAVRIQLGDGEYRGIVYNTRDGGVTWTAAPR